VHCHPLSVSVAVVLTPVFATGLAENAPADWTYGKRFSLALFYLFWAGCILLLMWFLFTISEPSSCDLCMYTTQAGSVVTGTLLFHTYYSCAGTIIGSCIHNHTTDLVCSHGNQHICFNPIYHPREQRLRDQEHPQHWKRQPHPGV
jgi:hypothetical protein